MHHLRLRPSSRRRRVSALALLGVCLYASQGLAVVEQTDGTVVPVSIANCPGSGNPAGCLQVGLNTGEGLPATSTTNPVNAIFSAVTSPEIFSVPQSNGNYGNVTVQDLIEGAGFENTFGWYNASDPTKLYAITPCADEPVSSRTVNFQTEFAQGRYLGGFIGFFLITPEGAPVGNNCGAVSNVGHIYYTEQARNGDGNYVHYLLYPSKANPLAYYFGFEDLYRGGDNDFEDMFLKVTGLLAPCTPSAEICDNKDNNCDGLIDNMPVDAGGSCGASDVGACSFGTLNCQAGALVCVGSVGPQPEACNNVDDDCNGIVDDNPSGSGATCGSDVGECNFGATQCIGGAMVCIGGKGPSLEVCNMLDDDCNGTVDDLTIDAGGPCGSNVGACLPGVLTCQNGAIVCVGGTTGTPELCNAIDDDCNGAIDDGDPGGGGACGSDVGVCEAGKEHCVGGTIVCVGAISGTSEICDGLDNDCDGTADQLAPCPGESKCVAGTCADKCKFGEFPCPGGTICFEGYCVPATCDNTVCQTGFMCVQGICVPDGMTGAGGAAGAGGATGAGGAGTGGTSSSSNSGGNSGEGGAGNSEPKNWGLSTGGGGTLCSTRPGTQENGSAAIALFAALSAYFSRRNKNTKNGEGSKA